MLTAGSAQVSFVPWKVLEPGDAVESPLVLFWVPASTADLRRSPLLESRDLTLYSARCVAMRIVRIDDSARLTQLDIRNDLPAAVLADRTGRVLGAVGSDGNSLSVRKVEALVRDELERRSGEAGAMLDRARELALGGDTEGAVAIYRSIAEERCVTPRQGRDAQRALRKLRRR